MITTPSQTSTATRQTQETYDRRIPKVVTLDDLLPGFSPGSTVTADEVRHAVVPGSLKFGEVRSTDSCERADFSVKLLDGRTVKGQIALRVVVEETKVKVYCMAHPSGVRRVPA